MSAVKDNKREFPEEELDPAQDLLMRQVALKMLAAVEEEERARRITEEAQENALKSVAYDKLISVQEDLVRTINLMQVGNYGNNNAAIVAIIISKAGSRSVPHICPSFSI